VSRGQIPDEILRATTPKFVGVLEHEVVETHERAGVVR
jgi:hypothetical protein